jgi:hypothetical protein
LASSGSALIRGGWLAAFRSGEPELPRGGLAAAPLDGPELPGGGPAGAPLSGLELVPGALAAFGGAGPVLAPGERATDCDGPELAPSGGVARAGGLLLAGDVPIWLVPAADGLAGWTGRTLMAGSGAVLASSGSLAGGLS